MHSVISIFRLLLLFLSIIGFVLYIHKKTKIRIEFIPIIVFSSITVIIYLASLLNIMLYVTYATYLSRLGLFIFFLVSKQLKIIFNKNNLTIGSIFIILAFCYFVIVLRSNNFIHYDNFSHWGIVVKDMLMFNRLPNLESFVINNKTYPLGSSLFIYYISRIIGTTESKMMIAQMILMLSCIFSMFGLIKNKKSYLPGIIIICAAIYMIAGKIGFSLLLVDNLLPLIGIATTTIVFYYRNDVKRASILSLPLLIVTILIKNSGIFFVTVVSLFLLYIAFKAKKEDLKKREIATNFAYVLGVIFISFFMLFLWKQHTDYVFPGIIPRNTMSIENYISVFTSKTSQQISEIISNFVNKIFNIQTISTRTLLFANIGTVVLIIITKLSYRKNMRGTILGIICANVLFLLYALGYLGAYIFSMPTGRDVILGSYDRYLSSIIIYLIGILVLSFLYDYEKFFNTHVLEINDKKVFQIYSIKKVIFVTMILATIIIVGSTSISNNYKKLYPIRKYKNSIPKKIERLVGDNWSGYSNKKYIVYASDSSNKVSNGFIQRVVMYKTFSPKINVLSSIEAGLFLETLKDYDYFIILDDDQKISEFMSKYYDKSDFFGVYPIQETFFK